MTDHAATVPDRRIGVNGLAVRIIAAAVRVKLHERDLLDESRESYATDLRNETAPEWAPQPSFERNQRGYNS